MFVSSVIFEYLYLTDICNIVSYLNYFPYAYLFLKRSYLKMLLMKPNNMSKQ